MWRDMLPSLQLGLLLASSGLAHVLPGPDTSEFNDSSAAAPFLQRRRDDAADFGWIHKWSAIGDSFTAGIGSGRQLGKIWHNFDDWNCSRYDQAYPMLLNSAFGSAVKTFQYLACSGHRSEGIYEQVTKKLENDMNLVIMTAGGNDLCLASMIKKCVFIPYDGESTCTEVIEKAEENVRTILKPNLKSILLALDSHMAKDSIVVYNGYAQFFNTDDEDTCTKNQEWGFLKLMPKHWTATGLKLDVARRKRFNALVISINNAIKEVIEDVKNNSKVKYKIGFANWDRWVYDGVRGQFCDPKGDGNYPDPKQPDLQFIKQDTRIKIHQDLKKRSQQVDTRLAEEMPQASTDETPLHPQEVYRSLLWNSVNPLAAVRHRLSPRDTPSPPGCPGDGDFDPTYGLGLPDTFGRNFHPNEKGHVTIASFAMSKMIKLRAEVLGQDASCKIVDDFRCWQWAGSRGYADADHLRGNVEDFCNTLEVPKNEVGWKRSKTYHEGTPDEHTYTLELTSPASTFDKNQCLESMRKVAGCDGYGFRWAMGGIWRRGAYSYRIDLKRSNRPWPPAIQPHGDCKGQYKGVLSSFAMHGGGWASWDNGQETLKKSIKSCIGSEPTSWKFWYYDQPDKDGNEWAASFNTPIWVNARCFANNKVQKGAGGLTNGCSGTG